MCECKCDTIAMQKKQIAHSLINTGLSKLQYGSITSINDFDTDTYDYVIDTIDFKATIRVTVDLRGKR